MQITTKSLLQVPITVPVNRKRRYGFLLSAIIVTIVVITWGLLTACEHQSNINAAPTCASRFILKYDNVVLSDYRQAEIFEYKVRAMSSFTYDGQELNCKVIPVYLKSYYVGARWTTLVTSNITLKCSDSIQLEIYSIGNEISKLSTEFKELYLAVLDDYNITNLSDGTQDLRQVHVDDDGTPQLTLYPRIGDTKREEIRLSFWNTFTKNLEKMLNPLRISTTYTCGSCFTSPTPLTMKNAFKFLATVVPLVATLVAGLKVLFTLGAKEPKSTLKSLEEGSKSPTSEAVPEYARFMRDGSVNSD